MNIATLKTLDKGTKIPRLEATVKASFKAEHRTGTTANGKPYDFWGQNVILQDSSGEIKAAFGWNSQGEALNGQAVPVVCSCVVDEYNGQKQLKSCKLLPAEKTYTQIPQAQATLPVAPTNGNGDKDAKITRMWAAGQTVALIVGGNLDPSENVLMLNQFVAWAEKGIVPALWREAKNNSDSAHLAADKINEEIDASMAEEEVPF